jgi:23S rRNA (uridine2552-2'-O)-methyltransferase
MKFSSKAWMQRHRTDVFVKDSVQQSMRSRAAYKLLEIQEKHKLIRQSDFVLDLGAAPGGWSVVAAKYLSKESNGLLLSVDLLVMDKVGNFPVLVGDFTSMQIQAEIRSLSDGRQPTVILSDMMSNTTGNKMTDHFRSMELCFSVLDFCETNLATGGKFLCKYFRGEDEGDLVDAAKAMFSTVKLVKPKASRDESAEIFLLATGRLGS